MTSRELYELLILGCMQPEYLRHVLAFLFLCNHNRIPFLIWIAEALLCSIPRSTLNRALIQNFYYMSTPVEVPVLPAEFKA
jgi:hypothetical protein